MTRAKLAALTGILVSGVALCAGATLAGRVAAPLGALIAAAPAADPVDPVDPANPANPAGPESTDSGDAVDRQVTQAVQRGLRWLQAKQNADGSWSAAVGFKLNQDYRIESQDRPHVGVTALAAMGFLAGGHLPDRGEYGETIARATDFVLSCVDGTSGFISRNGTRMYSHAFATLYLSEVYGMTRRPDVREKLQLAVDLIVRSQNQHGSWRYEPFAVESDMSITVCQLMALRSARNIGIKVPRSTIDRAVNYVINSYTTEDDLEELGRLAYQDRYYFLVKGSFKYQLQDSMNTRSSFALTAAGIASLYNAGVYSDERLRRSLDVLQGAYDRLAGRHDHYFYWYGNYYAVQAMYVAGDPWWSRYWARVRDDLLHAQQGDGRWVNSSGPGDAFGTAVATIILQVPYKYLPILQR